MEPKLPFTALDLRVFLSAVFSELRRATFDPDRVPLALALGVAAHNVPKVLIAEAAGETLRIPCGVEFASVDDFWRTYLLPILADNEATRAWTVGAFPDHAFASTTTT